MVERGELAAPDAAVAVGTLRVAGVYEALGDGRPLQREVVDVVERGHLVDRPRERAVVYQYAVGLALPDGVGAVVDVALLAPSHADEAYDVVLLWAHGVVAQGDARLGRRLSGDGGILTDDEVAVEGDDAADVEDDDLLVVAADGVAQRPRARVVQVGHVDHPSSSSAVGVASVALGAREGRHLCRHVQCGHSHHGQCQ